MSTAIEDLKEGLREAVRQGIIQGWYYADARGYNQWWIDGRPSDGLSDEEVALWIALHVETL